MSEDILTIKDISKSFPKVIANKNVSFNIKRNTVHALLGENGAGKSTLVKILYGLLKSDEGEIIFNNHPLKVQSPSEARKNKIGMVFQHFNLFETLSVFENLSIDATEDNKSLRVRINEILKKYNFSIDLDVPVLNLSAGQKQKVEIIRCLLRSPKVLIMDEPTSVLTEQETEEEAGDYCGEEEEKGEQS